MRELSFVRTFSIGCDAIASTVSISFGSTTRDLLLSPLSLVGRLLLLLRVRLRDRLRDRLLPLLDLARDLLRRDLRRDLRRLRLRGLLLRLLRRLLSRFSLSSLLLRFSLNCRCLLLRALIFLQYLRQ